MSVSTIGIAKADILQRRLKRMTNGVVVRSDQCRRLTAIHQQDREARRSRELLLHLRPSGRSVFGMFLDDLRLNAVNGVFG